MIKPLRRQLLKSVVVSRVVLDSPMWEGRGVDAAYDRWLAGGRPVPPPNAVKQRIVRSYGRRFALRTLVETGTFWGFMTNAVRDDFDEIYTIELSDMLHRRAKRFFWRYPHIHPIHGDSGRKLPELLGTLREPTLFWLDAHFSAGVTARGDEDTPIEKELRHVLKHPVDGHVILVDDARDFGTPGYPTIEQVRALVLEERPGWTFEVEDDVIRAHGAEPAGG